MLPMTSNGVWQHANNRQWGLFPKTSFPIEREILSKISFFRVIYNAKKFTYSDETNSISQRNLNPEKTKLPFEKDKQLHTLDISIESIAKEFNKKKTSKRGVATVVQWKIKYVSLHP